MKSMNDILKQKKNPVMNYNQFMNIFKGASKKYAGKASKDSGDKASASKLKQDLATDGVKSKGTPNLDKYTKNFLNTAKKKNVVGKK